MLIEHKADPGLKTRGGLISPLYYAAIHDQVECLRELIRVGVDVEVLNDRGYSPLTGAIFNENTSCVEILLDAGASVSNMKRAIPPWVHGIITKRLYVKRSLLALIGVLRKRFGVYGASTEHIGGKLPRDVVWLLSRHVWRSRFDSRWILPVV